MRNKWHVYWVLILILGTPACAPNAANASEVAKTPTAITSPLRAAEAAPASTPTPRENWDDYVAEIAVSVKTTYNEEGFYITEYVYPKENRILRVVNNETNEEIVLLEQQWLWVEIPGSSACVITSDRSSAPQWLTKYWSSILSREKTFTERTNISGQDEITTPDGQYVIAWTGVVRLRTAEDVIPTPVFCPTLMRTAASYIPEAAQQITISTNTVSYVLPANKAETVAIIEKILEMQDWIVTKRETPEGRAYAYFIFSQPIPLSNRENLLRITLTDIYKDLTAVHIQIEMAPPPD